MADTFDHQHFWDTVNKLYDQLEDLHGIDAVLDGIDERNLEELAYPPSNMGNLGGNPYNTSITLGSGDNSFDKLIRAYDVGQHTTPSNTGGTTTNTYTPLDFGWIEEAYQAASAWRLTAQSGLGAAAWPLLRVESSRFRDVAYAIVDLYATLESTVRSDWAGLSEQSSEWEGESADTFFSNFHQPFTDIIASHKFALDYLNSLVCAVKACNDAGQQSLQALVDEALWMVGDQLKKRAADNRGQTDGSAALLGSTITGIAAALLFPVPGVAAVLGATSVLLNHAASSVPPGAAEDVPISAHSATTLDEAIGNEITQLKDNVRAVLDGVDQQASDMDGYIDNFKEGEVAGSRVNAWIPIQAEVVPGPDFHHESKNY
jgi:hypothetical protein